MMQEGSSTRDSNLRLLSCFSMTKTVVLASSLLEKTRRIGQVMVKTFLISPEIVHFKPLSSLGKHIITGSVLHSPKLRPRMAQHDSHPSTPEVETGGLAIQGHHLLQGDFEASLRDFSTWKWQVSDGCVINQWKLNLPIFSVLIDFNRLDFSHQSNDPN